MPVARCLVVLLGVVSIVGCARMGSSAVRVSADPLPGTAEEELALLRLAEHVEAAAQLYAPTDPPALSPARER
jgi:hypothetical protein